MGGWTGPIIAAAILTVAVIAIEILARRNRRN